MVKLNQGTTEESVKAAYTELVKKAEPKPPRLRNALYAFFVGG
ncbi:MAG: hypothetical protein K0R39_4928, partial [Symbiobacteriaceae bacterium]|nr:hypothetical protein [Symbiobacteriaceae bacterium]